MPGQSPEARAGRILKLLDSQDAPTRRLACRWTASEDYPIPAAMASAAASRLVKIGTAGRGSERGAARSAVLRLWPNLTFPERAAVLDGLIAGIWEGTQQDRRTSAALLRKLAFQGDSATTEHILSKLLPVLENPRGRSTGRAVYALRGVRKKLTDAQVEGFHQKAMALLASPEARQWDYGWRLFQAFGIRFPEGTMFEIGRLGVHLAKSPSGDARKSGAYILNNWALHHAPDDLYREMLDAMDRLAKDPWESVRAELGNAREVLERARSRPPVDWSAYFVEPD